MINKKEILRIEGLSKQFGGLKALDSLYLQVMEGSIHGIIGPNGAGKTTLFNLISGLLKPTEGEIFFSSKPIHHLPPERIASLGISRTFQKSSIVNDMTVIENVMSGMYRYSSKSPILDFFLAPLSFYALEREIRKKALGALDFVGMLPYAQRWSQDLVWVERQLAQLARALVSNPKILMLDEPASGMGKEETEKMKEVIQKINEQGVTLLIISHDMQMVMHLCDVITVLDHGQTIFEGSSQEVQNDSKVLEAYIGE